MSASDQILREWHTSDDDSIYSGAMELILGILPHELPGRFETWMSLIHPDDHVAYRTQIEAVLLSGGSFEIEYRARKSNGKYTAVRDHVLAREVEWRWWDNPAIRRPMVSLVALTPADTFEAGRPERGVALRVRCAWENTAQGLPKSPLTELERLVVDGRDVQPSLVERRRANGQREDHYHLFHVPSEGAPAAREATAMVREVGSGARHERTVRFHA